MVSKRQYTALKTLCSPKHNNGSDNLQYTADGKPYEWDDGFLIDEENKLHHTHIFEDDEEQEIVIPYENGSHNL